VRSTPLAEKACFRKIKKNPSATGFFFLAVDGGLEGGFAFETGLEGLAEDGGEDGLAPAIGIDPVGVDTVSHGGRDRKTGGGIEDGNNAHGVQKSKGSGINF
jgi:hypothetical protein